MFIDKEVLYGLNRTLKLNFNGTQQDWDLEFADFNRVSEFIDIVNKGLLTVVEKYAVVSLIFASYDDYLGVFNDYDENIWMEIVKILDKEPSFYYDLLDYWAMWESGNKKPPFLITPKVRDYITSRGLLPRL